MSTPGDVPSDEGERERVASGLAGADDRPGLPAPVPRQSVHRRTIETEGFLREDGLFDIEARLVDTKSHGYRDSLGRDRQPGGRLHDICVRLTLDAEMTVRDIEVAMPATPFSICTQAMPSFRTLIGVRVGGGWRQAIRDRVAVSEGCTHVREMLSVMATVAFQTIASLSLRQSGLKLPSAQPRPQRPHFIDGCYAWDSGRAVVAFLYPDQVRKP